MWKEVLNEIYNETRNTSGGKVADYIPQLAKVNPDLYGISFCSVEGEQINIGDHSPAFCLQSCSKPLNYCLARMLNNNVHNHVGYEPSGREFNSFVLNREGLPHNPMINAGAIMISSLIEAEKEPSSRFEAVKEFYEKLGGGVGNIGFDNTVYLSEKHHADRNTSLAYYMRENGAFNNTPSPNDIQDALNLYFQCCSVTLNCETAAVIAGTLSNGGVCPITNKVVIKKEIVRDCLSLMYMCGMYDFSGQFAFKIGLPAKSGVSGCMLVVIPNVGGLCIWSPRLDEMGNSVRGIECCKKLVERTNSKYHIFQGIMETPLGTNEQVEETETVLVQRLITAASEGNLGEIKALEERISLDATDYDMRTALHLAAADGHILVVTYLLEKGVTAYPKDRWGNTPYHEARQKSVGCNGGGKQQQYQTICEMLEKER
jgi:glutaminase